ncbi:MATE family efflux transporter [Pelistega europaea]|uniref:MATE family efflux transporter n=1 Tax=Pelistega europaea TaxID=106147 RepID=A0A7Y4LAC7_9BURK|nr:MATE family efflux transporter [Pelistega europaea]NOL48846.1 MATE family efflux transporter [Pelistega europaea]
MRLSYSPLGTLNKQAMAVMLSWAATSIYGVVDIYFIALLGTHELTAAGIASPFMWLFNTVASGFALAISIFTARYQAESTFRQQVVQPMLIGIAVLSLLAWAIYSGLLHAMIEGFSGNTEVVEQAWVYFGTWMATYFSTLLFTSGAAMMRGFELYRQQTSIIIVSCVLNAIFSPILMFPPIGMGIAGAVYGTVLAQLCAIGLFFRQIRQKTGYSVLERQCLPCKEQNIERSYSLSSDYHSQISKDNKRQASTLPDSLLYISQLKSVFQLFKMALVTATSSMFWPVSVLISTYYMSKLGEIEVAMMGVIAKVQPLLMTPIFAIGIATSVAVSKYFQQNDRTTIKQYLHTAVFLMVVWQAGIAVVLYIIREPFAEFMLPHTPQAVGLLQYFLLLIPTTVIGRGLIFLLSQTLPAMNLAPNALIIDFIFALCLHTLCYLIGYWMGDFEVTIVSLAILNVIGVSIFVVVSRGMRHKCL